MPMSAALYRCSRAPKSAVVRTILIAIAIIGAVGGASGCNISCAPCIGGWGFCGGNPINCGPCPTLCPGFCMGTNKYGNEPAAVPCAGFCANDAGTLAIPCPGFCVNDAGTAATPCDGG